MNASSPGEDSGGARTALEDAVQLLARGDWNAAHGLVQAMSGPLADWAHGIVHLLEGDLDNAGYWYRRAGRIRPGADAVQAEIAALRAAVRADSSTGRTP